MSEIAKQVEPAPASHDFSKQENQRPALHTILDQLARLKHDVRKAATAGARLAKVAPASLLLTLLRDDNPMIRFAAVEALRLGHFTLNKTIVDTLLSKIDDRQSYIATAAIRTLGRKRVSDADEELISCLSMQDSRIAAAALSALSEIGTAPIDEYVEEFLDSDDPIRIRAAAIVVGHRELTQFAEKLHDLIFQLRADAEIPPQTRRINHYLTAVRSLIDALGALQYREAIDTLKDLSINQIGLRSISLRTLHHMGVDVVDLACAAQETFPTANLSRLLAEISNDFADDDASLVKLNQHLNSNRDKLAELGTTFVEGITCRGKAIKVAHAYAIIQLQPGMPAYMPAAEYRWSATTDLLPFQEELAESNDFQVVEIDQQRGRIKVSRRALQDDPLVAFQS